MKFEIKKFAKFSAILASSALLFSCDGDDGKDGATGAPFTQLKNSDLIPNVFTASQLRMTLDPSTTGSYTGTPEVFIDFDSRFLGTLENASLNAGLLTDQVVGAPQLRINTLAAPGNGTFTIGSIKGDVDDDGDIDVNDSPLFEQMTFTSLQIVQNTYIGTFTTLVGTTAEPVTLSQNAPSENVNIATNIVEPADFDLANVQKEFGGTKVLVQNTASPRATLYTLNADEVAVRFESVGNEDDLVFVLKAPADLNFTGLVFDPANTFTSAGFVATAVPKRIVAASGSEFATGSFRLDIDSTQGGDTGLLSTNFPSGS